MAEHFENEEFVMYLTYLADIFSHLNDWTPPFREQR